MAKKHKHSIFISYSHSEPDREWVRKFVHALEDKHASVWFDENRLVPGELWTKAIEEGLRSSDIVAIVLSAQTSQMPSVLFELGAAIGMGKRIVPIVTPGLDPSALPVPLRLRHFLLRGSPEETAAELLGEQAITA